ncbi:hypothetical protein SAMN05443507_11960 [Alicyclobacillus tolerans]|uniref:DUF1173 family protein n=2 Tax=Alicyclobacillus tolerans TaxID=90970 RepID=A0A1M6UEE2_9BACL|nr:hypothetical protein SAMN05443507_11960 [Alicyclobacillus montanus]
MGQVRKMPELIYHYSGNRIQYGNYSDIIVPSERGKKVWNQQVLRKLVEPERPWLVECCCQTNPSKRVSMHVVERPIGKRRYYLANNPNSPYQHTSDCPKKQLESVVSLPPILSKNDAVRWSVNENGEMQVDVHVSLFAGGLREMTEDDVVSDNVEMNESRIGVRGNKEEAERRRTVRSQVEFGGLIREWYLIARHCLLENRPASDISTPITPALILGVMLKTLLEGKITANGKELRSIAHIPHPSVKRHIEGTRKILLGIYDGNFESGKFVKLRGLKSASWRIDIPEQFAKSFVGYSVGKTLTAVRVIRKGDHWRLTHAPFGALLAQPDAMWVESKIEEQAYAFLKKMSWTIEKPYHKRDDLGGLRPDFVLHGLDRDVVVEIYGRVGDEKYNAHKEAKREFYRALQREGLIHYVEWDAEEKDGQVRFLHSLQELKRKSN